MWSSVWWYKIYLVISPVCLVILQTGLVIVSDDPWKYRLMIKKTKSHIYHMFYLWTTSEKVRNRLSSPNYIRPALCLFQHFSKKIKKKIFPKMSNFWRLHQVRVSISAFSLDIWANIISRKWKLSGLVISDHQSRLVTSKKCLVWWSLAAHCILRKLGDC